MCGYIKEGLLTALYPVTETQSCLLHCWMRSPRSSGGRHLQTLHCCKLRTASDYPNVFEMALLVNLEDVSRRESAAQSLFICKRAVRLTHMARNQASLCPASKKGRDNRKETRKDILLHIN